VKDKEDSSGYDANVATIMDLSDDELYERWQWELTQDEHTPNDILVASLEREARNRGFEMWTVLDGLGLVAAKVFNPDLHPRGHDGKFIEVLGWINLRDFTVTNKRTGKAYRLDGQRGQVVRITPDPKAPNRPTIKVRIDGPDGKTRMFVDVKPENVEQAAPTVAKLTPQDTANDLAALADRLSTPGSEWVPIAGNPNDPMTRETWESPSGNMQIVKRSDQRWDVKRNDPRPEYGGPPSGKTLIDTVDNRADAIEVANEYESSYINPARAMSDAELANYNGFNRPSPEVNEVGYERERRDAAALKAKLAPSTAPSAAPDAVANWDSLTPDEKLNNARFNLRPQLEKQSITHDDVTNMSNEELDALNKRIGWAGVSNDYVDNLTADVQDEMAKRGLIEAPAGSEPDSSPDNVAMTAIDGGSDLPNSRLRDLAETYGVTIDNSYPAGPNAQTGAIDWAVEDVAPDVAHEDAQTFADDHNVALTDWNDSGPNGWPTASFSGDPVDVMAALDDYESGTTPDVPAGNTLLDKLAQSVGQTNPPAGTTPSVELWNPISSLPPIPATFSEGDRVKVDTKFNAKSTNPLTGEQNLNDSFTPIKRNTGGDVLAVGNRFSIVKFDGVQTPQEMRNDLLKPSTPIAAKAPSVAEAPAAPPVPSAPSGEYTQISDWRSKKWSAAQLDEHIAAIPSDQARTAEFLTQPTGPKSVPQGPRLKKLSDDQLTGMMNSLVNDQHSGDTKGLRENLRIEAARRGIISGFPDFPKPDTQVTEVKDVGTTPAPSALNNDYARMMDAIARGKAPTVARSMIDGKPMDGEGKLVVSDGSTTYHVSKLSDDKWRITSRDDYGTYSGNVTGMPDQTRDASGVVITDPAIIKMLDAVNDGASPKAAVADVPESTDLHVGSYPFAVIKAPTEAAIVTEGKKRGLVPENVPPAPSSSGGAYSGRDPSVASPILPTQSKINLQNVTENPYGLADGTYFVIQSESTGHLRAVGSAGFVPGPDDPWALGRTVWVKHDQTGAPIGASHEVVGIRLPDGTFQGIIPDRKIALSVFK